MRVVRGLQVAQWRAHVAGLLKVLLRPEGRQRNAPEDSRERLDLLQASLCQVRRQAQARQREGPCGGERGCGRERGHRKDRGNARDGRGDHQEVQQDRRQVPDVRVEPRQSVVIRTVEPEAAHEGDQKGSQVEQEGREEGAKLAHPRHAVPADLRRQHREGQGRPAPPDDELLRPAHQGGQGGQQPSWRWC